MKIAAFLWNAIDSYGGNDKYFRNLHTICVCSTKDVILISFQVTTELDAVYVRRWQHFDMFSLRLSMSSIIVRLNIRTGCKGHGMHFDGMHLSSKKKKKEFNLSTFDCHRSILHFSSVVSIPKFVLRMKEVKWNGKRKCSSKRIAFEIREKPHKLQ